MTHNYTIIPDLVSIETNNTSINDFLLSQNLTFYKSSKRQKYHYQVFVGEKIEKPNVFDFRIGNYAIAEDLVVYERNLGFGQRFAFSYNAETKTFIFNRLYKYHFVNIGDIFTVGRHLFHVIEADLARNGFFIVLGAAVAKGGKTIVLLAPNGNGKTAFVNQALLNGYSYVAENFLVLYVTKNSVHGVAPVFKNKSRETNKELANLFEEKSIEVVNTAKVSDFFVLSHKGPNVSKAGLVANFVSTYTGYYKKNNLVRSLLYYALENERMDEKYALLARYITEKAKIIRNIKEILHEE